MILLLLALIAAPQGRPLSGPALEQRTQEIAALLRCPVCQGMSVADSPSTVAQDMKREVREMLAQGYTEEQILARFQQSYGDFVLLKPRNPWVWLLPVVLLLAGAAVVITTAKKLSAPRPTDSGERSTDPYIEQVRKLVQRD